MPEAICDTSPLQYLHQLGLLHLLPRLIGHIIIPPAVVDELAVGRSLGVNLPDVARLERIAVRTPSSAPALPLVTDLGAGETQVLALALENPGTPVILDDGLARRTARRLGLGLTGTLGLLIDAKHAGIVPAVAPVLNQLQALRFRLAPATRTHVLALTGEASTGP